jgi:2,4-dienoyl-CoA reductase-like NADH-dependent reductase (Old Yellow Enzyme family)
MTRLFSPSQIRSVTLKNRVVVAPMHQYASRERFATDRHPMNAGWSPPVGAASS